MTSPPSPELRVEGKSMECLEVEERNRRIEADRQTTIHAKAKQITAYLEFERIKQNVTERQVDTFSDVFPYPPKGGYNTYETAFIFSSSSSSSADNSEDDGGGKAGTDNHGGEKLSDNEADPDTWTRLCDVGNDDISGPSTTESSPTGMNSELEGYIPVCDTVVEDFPQQLDLQTENVAGAFLNADCPTDAVMDLSSVVDTPGRQRMVARGSRLKDGDSVDPLDMPMRILTLHAWPDTDYAYESPPLSWRDVLLDSGANMSACPPSLVTELQLTRKKWPRAKRVEFGNGTIAYSEWYVYLGPFLGNTAVIDSMISVIASVSSANLHGFSVTMGVI
jgi:hypothetical protein